MTDFGWSYPPGCNGVPDDEREDCCEVCGVALSEGCEHVSSEDETEVASFDGVSTVAVDTEIATLFSGLGEATAVPDENYQGTQFVNAETAEQRPALPATAQSAKTYYKPVDEPQGVLIPEAAEEWRAYWKEMPHFEQKEVKPYAQIIVRFADAAGLADFQTRIGQKCEKTTKSLWHPQQKRGLDSRMVYDEREDGGEE